MCKSWALGGPAPPAPDPGRFSVKRSIVLIYYYRWRGRCDIRMRHLRTASRAFSKRQGRQDNARTEGAVTSSCLLATRRDASASSCSSGRSSDTCAVNLGWGGVGWGGGFHYGGERTVSLPDPSIHPATT